MAPLPPADPKHCVTCRTPGGWLRQTKLFPLPSHIALLCILSQQHRALQMGCKIRTCFSSSAGLKEHTQSTCCLKTCDEAASDQFTTRALFKDPQNAASQTRQAATPPASESWPSTFKPFPSLLGTGFRLKALSSSNTAAASRRGAPTSSIDMSHTLQMSFSISSSSSVWISSGFALGSVFSGLMT